MPRVLVIDDDEMVRSTVQAMLEARGHEVTVAVDGDDGLRRLRKQPFDLILCDIFMPNRDGIGMLREVRRMSAGLPIIMMTGGSPSTGRLGEQVDVDYLHMARLLGATLTIGKPFTINQLTTFVEQALTAKTPKPSGGAES